jgi:ABC-type sugar transport system permease subunit
VETRNSNARAAGPCMPSSHQVVRSRHVMFTLHMLPGLAVLIGVILVAGPLVATIVRSVLAGPADSVSLQNFIGLLSDQRFRAVVLNTLITGTGATILSCVFALGLAWIVARTDAPGRKWFDTLNVVPFFLSPYVGAMSWIGLAAPNGGLLNHAVNLYLSLPKTRFVRTGDVIRPRLHGRRCPRSGRSGARPAHPFRAKHEDATHYNRRRISQGSASGALR